MDTVQEQTKPRDAPVKALRRPSVRVPLPYLDETGIDAGLLKASIIENVLMVEPYTNIDANAGVIPPIIRDKVMMLLKYVSVYADSVYVSPPVTGKARDKKAVAVAAAKAQAALAANRPAPVGTIKKTNTVGQDWEQEIPSHRKHIGYHIYESRRKHEGRSIMTAVDSIHLSFETWTQGVPILAAHMTRVANMKFKECFEEVMSIARIMFDKSCVQVNENSLARKMFDRAWKCFVPSAEILGIDGKPLPKMLMNSSAHILWYTNKELLIPVQDRIPDSRLASSVVQSVVGDTAVGGGVSQEQFAAFLVMYQADRQARLVAPVVASDASNATTSIATRRVDDVYADADNEIYGGEDDDDDGEEDSDDELEDDAEEKEEEEEVEEHRQSKLNTKGKGTGKAVHPYKASTSSAPIGTRREAQVNLVKGMHIMVPKEAFGSRYPLKGHHDVQMYRGQLKEYYNRTKAWGVYYFPTKMSSTFKIVKLENMEFGSWTVSSKDVVAVMTQEEYYNSLPNVRSA